MILPPVSWKKNRVQMTGVRFLSPKPDRPAPGRRIMVNRYGQGKALSKTVNTESRSYFYLLKQHLLYNRLIMAKRAAATRVTHFAQTTGQKNKASTTMPAARIKRQKQIFICSSPPNF